MNTRQAVDVLLLLPEKRDDLKTEMKKLNRLMNKCNQEMERHLSKAGQTAMSFRKTRTRKLIQLGGLSIP
ncbi:MAG: hypothetical protein K2Y18_01090 [Alphaproteobacteria bacterium]|nr:hypothetical protein [Alphaproteobacteria bacterium]